MERKSNRGFSLIEAVVTLGVLSIAMLVMANLIISSQKGQKSVATYADFVGVVNTLQLVGSLPSCKGSFTASCCGNALKANGKNLTYSGTQQSIQKVTLGNSTLVDTTQALDGWNISLDLGKQISSNGNTYLTTLNLSMNEKKGTQELGNSIRDRSFPISVTTDARGTVIDCSISSAANGSNGFGNPAPVNMNTGTYTANTDGIVTVTSGQNCGIEGYSGNLSTPVLNVEPRDKYGQGPVAITMPVKGGDSFKVTTYDVQGSSPCPGGSAQFIPMGQPSGGGPAITYNAPAPIQTPPVPRKSPCPQCKVF